MISYWRGALLRLRQIAAVLADAVPRLHFKTVSTSDYNAKIAEYRDAIDAALAIRNTGVLTEEADAVLAFDDIVAHASKQIVVARADYDRFDSAVTVLRNRASYLGDILKTILPPEGPDQIAVRLPDEHDLGDIASTLQEVQQALGQAIVNPYVNGDIRLISFDRGSNWLELALATASAASLIGWLLHLILDLESRKVDIEARRQLLRNLGLQNDLVEAAEKKFEHELETMRETQVDDMAKAVGAPDDDKEYRRRLEHTLRLLASLVQRGLEVHPALTAPTELRAKFPAPSQLATALRQLPMPKREIEGGTNNGSA